MYILHEKLLFCSDFSEFQELLVRRTSLTTPNPGFREGRITDVLDGMAHLKVITRLSVLLETDYRSLLYGVPL